MRRFRSLVTPGALTTLCVAFGLNVAADASAAWPPAETATAADMALPANWPNDPDYGYDATHDGQWNYYSFIPEPSGMLKPRPQETASGMSIDLAWRYTIGDPRVKIVITDSGIDWKSEDLLGKAWINHRELQTHRPLHADTSTCGDLDPALHPNADGSAPPPAELAGFDCNGDGILTVSDYAETPGLLPEASEGHPKGDKNNNMRLDAGDLILNYSDSIDDDANGYVDDISGWDFMKNDNDPYDDTLYGHGTGEARDSVSQANNGVGSAGGCPLCRFIPTRVGDSFISDVQAFGTAVIYAADNGAKIVQCALGTINQTNFSRAAIDYAYSKGVLVVTSMADEHSRHHNVPATANHTLPVHAIQYSGSSATQATSYLAFHPCSNYGGQNLLSASGTGCSSEATGQLSGIAGLVMSAGLKYGVNLTPNEAMQIFFATTDDIDVPESREMGSPYKWSHEGFDQRFGYGRVNANRAVLAVRDGRIPPEVDVTSPEWFEILYDDQVVEAVEIVGTVAAKRANSYDYLVEWAPGVQPLDGEYTLIQQETNIDPTVVMGQSGPLASLDVRNITLDHARDVDSPNGENDHTITVRVRAVAHYGGDVGDVPGEMRRTYYVHRDPTLLKGFPMYLGDSGEGSPKMADIDGDGVRDLIYPTGGGLLHVLRITTNGPEELEGFPFRANRIDGLAMPAPTPTVPVYLGAPGYAPGGVDPDLGLEPFENAPAVADLDGDGSPEIAVASFSGTVYVIDSAGRPRDGWPRRLPEVPSCPLDPTVTPPDPCMNEEVRIARGAFAAPVLEDLDKDGKLEIIQAAFDGKVYVFTADGEDLPGWPVSIHYTGNLSKPPDRNRILTTPAVGDFNGDGAPDLLVGSNERLGEEGQSGAIYVIDGRGNDAPGGAVLPGWPITITSFNLFPLLAEGVPNSGVIATFDGTKAAVMHGNATPPLILPADPGAQVKLNETPLNAIPQREDPYNPGQIQRGVAPSSIFGPLTKAAQPNTMLPLFSQPSIGDVDQDGTPDVIASGGSLNLAINLQSSSGDTGLESDHLLAVWSGKTGQMMPASPFVLEDYTFFNSHAIADISGDDYPEILTGSGGYFLHAIDACGREPEGWPKFTGQWIIPTPALGDLDGDGSLEVAIGTRSGWLYAWHTEATIDSIIEWESYHHDNRNTGNLDTPLEQGGKRKAKTPLTEATCAAPAPPAVEDGLRVAGGCGACAVGEAQERRSGPEGWLSSLALGAMIAARRRRRRA